MLNLLLAAICLGQTTTFTFEGGSDYDLCKNISQAISQPVVMLAEPERKWPKFSFEYENIKDFKQKLRNKLSLDQISDSTCGLASQSYGRNIFLFEMQEMVKEQKQNKASFSIIEELTDITTENGPISLSTFLSAMRTHKTKWHWFLNDMMLVSYVKGASEKTIINTVAEAVGAKVAICDDEAYLEVDPARYRARGVALMSKLAVTAETLPCDYLFTGSCLKELTDMQVVQLLKSPNEELQIPITSKAVMSAAQVRLEIHFPVKPDKIKRDKSAYLAWEFLSPKIDWRRPPYADLRPGRTFGQKYFGKPEDPCEWVF